MPGESDYVINFHSTGGSSASGSHTQTTNQQPAFWKKQLDKSAFLVDPSQVPKNIINGGGFIP